MRYNSIYKITNLINGKLYIGKHETDNLDDGYMGSGKLIRAAIEKYGIDAFKKEILFVFDNPRDMDVKEAEIVTESFVKRDDTYNLLVGGRGGFGYINEIFNPRSDKEKTRRKKISATQLSKGVTPPPFKHTPESIATRVEKFKAYQAKWGNIWLGRQHSQTTKEKIGRSSSVTQSGERNSQFGTCWISREGDRSRKVALTDLDTWIALGWRRGRKA